jgi:hypothetical protein
VSDSVLLEVGELGDSVAGRQNESVDVQRPPLTAEFERRAQAKTGRPEGLGFAWYALSVEPLRVD